MGIEGLFAREDQLHVKAYGKEAPIQLMGMRVASAAMRDDWTETLITWLPEYKRYGVNSAVVFWQGSSGGWTNPTGEQEIPEHKLGTWQVDRWEANAASFCRRNGDYAFEPDPAKRCHQVAFGMDRDYEVGEAVGKRMKRIIETMAELDMVAVVGIFYFRTFQQMRMENKRHYDFRRAARRAAEYLNDYKNIIWYPYNEYHYHSEKDYGPNMTSERAIVEEIKAVNPDWLCGGVDKELELTITDSHSYLFDTPANNPLLNVETFALGAGGNDRFSGLCHNFGIWGEEGYTVEASRFKPATKNDFYHEVEGALARPSYHLFAHLQGWYQGGYTPESLGLNFMGMTPGELNGPPLKAFNFYSSASPHYANATLVDDDNKGQGREGSRGVRWYYEYLRDHYSKVRHPYFDKGAWDLQRFIEVEGE